ncbi:hypothetical protein ACLB2K_063415 [Fragaria x ananassa]
MESVSSFEISQILGCVQTAVLRCNVEALNVFIRVKVILQTLFGENTAVSLKRVQVEFPSCVFVCGTLKSLTLNVSHVILKSPCFSPSSSSSNLVNLKLGNVTIENGDGFCKWVSVSCKSLKELSLWGLEGLKNVTIQSSSLESLVIQQLLGLFQLNISGEKLEKSDGGRLYALSGIALQCSAFGYLY